jgi:hypothetical protein
MHRLRLRRGNERGSKKNRSNYSFHEIFSLTSIDVDGKKISEFPGRDTGGRRKFACLVKTNGRTIMPGRSLGYSIFQDQELTPG